MPACRICKQRIDLSQTGVRAYKCANCEKLVCRNHFDSGKELCFNCAGLPISRGKTSFSFIRRASDIKFKKG